MRTYCGSFKIIDRVQITSHVSSDRKHFHVSGLSLFGTYTHNCCVVFTQVTAMAATANATLIEEMARVMGTEARAVYNVNLWHLYNGGRGGNCTPGGPGGVGGHCSGNITNYPTRGAFLSIYGCVAISLKYLEFWLFG